MTWRYAQRGNDPFEPLIGRAHGREVFVDLQVLGAVLTEHVFLLEGEGMDAFEWSPPERPAPEGPDLAHDEERRRLLLLDVLPWGWTS